MRQLFSSPRLENVEAVARLLNEAGIDTWVSESRSYKGNRRGTFSYKDSDRASPPGVWIVKAEDVTRARALLIEAGLIESTRPDSYLPAPPPSSASDNEPLRRAHRIRLGVLMVLAVAVILTLVRTCGSVREDRSHIVPVYTSPPS
ncbi:MAG: pathogenicity-like protein [Chiayiivirga sp.]|jgi:hypothetical protein|uniref:pathogenicity-like protein n=1 Tax=Chiayiivirga sp. TaxID=2041042 RepID=UPI0025B8CF39|nr:pathogenicity-like protein [Chiayiivirga sp.]MCI1710225.1 pathogenicity-like protein [Chiayiivirga sp.]MCI1728981.1 pathogenicity-like protein [Chiayiivirga sp.]